MAIRIIADSASDISMAAAAAHNIQVLPLRIIFDDAEYIDGINLSPPEFYEKLAAAATLPTTSQVSISAFAECFEAADRAGDDVIVITLSQKLSGTYQAAAIARSAFSSRIHIIDSRTVTLGQALLVREAIRLRDAGSSAEEIVAYLEALKYKVCLFAVIDNLKYLKMGGRLSSASAVTGTFLHVKPIITVADGLVSPVAKARGLHAAFEKVVALCAQCAVRLDGPIVFGSTNAPASLAILHEHFEKRFGKNPAEYAQSDIGPTVGVHVGAGAAGIAFVGGE